MLQSTEAKRMDGAHRLWYAGAIMIRTVLYYAHLIDAFLRKILGRPYQVVLSIALIYEIIRRTHEFMDAAHKSVDFWHLIFVVLLGSALVINQLADLYEHLGTREERDGGRHKRQGRRLGGRNLSLEQVVTESFREEANEPGGERKEPKG